MIVVGGRWLEKRGYLTLDPPPRTSPASNWRRGESLSNQCTTTLFKQAIEGNKWGIGSDRCGRNS